MKRRRLQTILGGVLLLLALPFPGSAETNPARVRIELDEARPSASRGYLLREMGQPPLEFQVGYGKQGVLPEGSRFKGGYSLLGQFRVNAILSHDRFEMLPELVAASSKTETYLRENLFSNMSAIDFDGDGLGQEYGSAYIGLEPLSETDQPFHFGVYAGKFRWYSYALHGTQDEARIGKSITGGCINLPADALKEVVKHVQLGDLVEIVSRPSQED